MMTTVKALDQFKDHIGSLAVQVPGRFIGQQQLWFGYQRPRERHPLLFAAGKLSCPVLRSIFQTNFFQPLASTC